MGSLLVPVGTAPPPSVLPGGAGAHRASEHLPPRSPDPAGLALKARLLAAGRIFVPPHSGLRVFPSKSSAGPTAGAPHLMFRIDGWYVNLEVDRDGDAPLRFEHRSGDRGTLWEGDRCLHQDVEVISTPLHAPGQAFINLDERCRFSCRFCSSPLLDHERYKVPDLQRLVDRLVAAATSGEVTSFALTSGVWPDFDGAIERMASVVAQLHQRTGLPIGVEPLAQHAGHLRQLRQAGASELKLNIQAATEEIFSAVCPGLSYARQWELLAEGVRLFGRGRVTSNLIIGLGEHDEEVEAAVRHLGDIGVVVTLRRLHTTSLIEEGLANALGGSPPRIGAERHLSLARSTRQILEQRGLETGTFSTMCHACKGCDL